MMPLSRRDFLALSAAVPLGHRFLDSLWQQQQQAVPLFTPIRRNVGVFTMRGGSIGYLVNPGAVAVVDSQFPAEAKACLDGLNERTGTRPVDFLINTHHHGDHSGGNISFRGSAKKVVAHEKAAEHMRMPPGGQPPADQLFPDTTFAESWSSNAGDERIRVKHYGRAHTSGDVVITFERANIAHMGDLAFNQRHPVVDRAAGASMKNWITVLERTLKDHDNDTIYIFGHANTGLSVTGNHADVRRFRDYLAAVLAFVDTQVKSGKTREQVLAMREPLAGFESFGRFGQANAREPLTVAYEEITSASTGG